VGGMEWNGMERKVGIKGMEGNSEWKERGKWNDNGRMDRMNSEAYEMNRRPVKA
jgi:hypothetical protein